MLVRDRIRILVPSSSPKKWFNNNWRGLPRKKLDSIPLELLINVIQPAYNVANNEPQSAAPHKVLNCFEIKLISPYIISH